MTHRIRVPTDAQYATLLEDLAALRFKFRQVIERHEGLVRDEWLGGSQEADQHEGAPEPLCNSFQALRQAENAVIAVDSQFAIYRALTGLTRRSPHD